jgi:hypothetical protein
MVVVEGAEMVTRWRWIWRRQWVVDALCDFDLVLKVCG